MEPPNLRRRPGDGVTRSARGAGAATSGRPILPAMRLVFVIGVVFVFGAGFQLVVMTSETDRFFAWTIASPVTAATIGAAYFVALAVALTSLTRRDWDLARVGIPGIVVFLWLTMLASLMHLGTFHLDDGPATAQVAAWAWIAIYVLDPPLATAAYIQQLRAPGVDPDRGAPVHSWVRALLVVAGAPVVAIGVALFVRPGEADSLWAWPMAPLAAQALAAWLVAVGLLALTAAVEADEHRNLPASIGFVVLAVLGTAAMMRFDEEPHDLLGWFWSAWLVLYAVLGVTGIVRALGYRRS